MEGLAPPLRLLLYCRRSLEKGEPLRTGIKKYIELKDESFANDVAQWIFLFETGRPTNEFLRQLSSSHRRHLLLTLERGLKREPILPLLHLIEQEIAEACEIEIQNQMTTLPYKALLPLLLFVFPAFMMILLGPLLLQLLDSMK